MASMDAETSKYLGGDVEHTHLVKGLDYALLVKIREEEKERVRHVLEVGGAGDEYPWESQYYLWFYLAFLGLR